jgi:hypothetical protein
MGEFSSQQRVSRSAAAALARAGNVAQSRSPHVSPRPILTPAAVSDAEDLDFSTLSRLHSLLSGSNILI